jgi:hypothetical protein
MLACSAASALEAPVLIASLVHTAPATTAFIEIGFVSMLDKPLQLRGELTWRGGAQLEKRIDVPYRETTIINGENVEVQREKKSPRHFTLDRAPELRGFLASFTALLSGNAEQLQQYHTLALSGDEHAWRLTLIPRDAALAKRIRRIDVYGSDKTLRCFNVQQSDGDSNVLLVEQLATAKLPAALTLPHLTELCGGVPQ